MVARRLFALAAPAAFALVLAAGAAAQTGGARPGLPRPPLDPGEFPLPSFTAARPVAPTFAPELAELAEEVTGEIAVDVRDDASAADIAALRSAFGLDLEPNSPLSDATDKIERAHVEPSRMSEIIARLSSDPRVEAAEPMSILRASFVPNDPLYAEKQWHLARVGAERAWSYSCGRGVTVAVIDTGVACFDKGPFSRGTDLAGTRCEGGYNFVDPSAEPSDDQGHGTHVAGTVAQTTNNGKGAAGLAHCATLMPVKVLNRSGWGTVANVAEGIRYAADHGAQIINLSLGGPIKSRILEKAVRHALGRGVTIVAAAGNSGRGVGYPAAYDGVIAVSATDSNDKIAWFSSRGSQIAVAAPGVGVTQQTVCNGGRDKCELFGTFNGTSMASPHVAGAAAMLVGLGVGEPSAIRDAISASARPKDDASLYGAGILDAGASAARVVLRHALIRLGLIVALALWIAGRIRRKGGRFVATPTFWGAALLAGVGLVPFAPMLGLGNHVALDLLARPFGEWSLALFGAGAHRWLPLANALPSLGLAALVFGARPLRPAVGGFALGSAALLTQLAFAAEVAYPLGSVALRLVCVVNALVCVWLARASLDTRG